MAKLIFVIFYLTLHISKIASLQHIINVKNINEIFFFLICVLCLRNLVLYTLSAYLHSDQPRFKCSPATRSEWPQTGQQSPRSGVSKWWPAGTKSAFCILTVWKNQKKNIWYSLKISYILIWKIKIWKNCWNSEFCVHKQNVIGPQPHSPSTVPVAAPCYNGKVGQLWQRQGPQGLKYYCLDLYKEIWLTPVRADHKT